ncbi:hypothetical protein NL676_018348 [Syzygium grande]|nr:hypothetical protein NL676_018348 [Syzygium grande]
MASFSFEKISPKTLGDDWSPKQPSELLLVTRAAASPWSGIKRRSSSSPSDSSTRSPPSPPLAARPSPPSPTPSTTLAKRRPTHEWMGSKLGRRVVHFANLPIKLLMPASFTNITKIALKTVPSATKIEIKRVLESLYGFDVGEVRTLNMEGKKKKRGGLLDLFPIHAVEEDRRSANKKGGSSMVEEGERKRHWLEGEDGERRKREKEFGERVRGSGAKFPWSFMKSGR